jgi:hypothetical protein
MGSTHHRSRHRSRRRLKRQALLALAILVLLAIAYLIARWLASSTGGFPSDPNSSGDIRQRAMDVVVESAVCAALPSAASRTHVVGSGEAARLPPLADCCR